MTLYEQASEYKLTELLGAAGATIGVIIAGTIFLQFLNTKYIELAKRYREIGSEYRGIGDDHGRHDPLRAQIRIYRRRLILMNRASSFAAVALLCFLVAFLSGGLSLIYPPVRPIKWVGTTGLAGGIALIFVAVTIELVEGFLARREIWEDIRDLDPEAQSLGR